MNITKRHYVGLIVSGLLLAALSPAHAATWNKTAAGTYDFNTNANWSSPATVPNGAGATANMFVNLSGGAAIKVNISSDVTLGLLQMGDTGGDNGWIELGSSGGKLIVDDGGAGRAIIEGRNGQGGSPSFNGNYLKTAIEMQDDLEIRPLASKIIFIQGGISEDATSRSLFIGQFGNTTFSGTAIVNSALTHTGGTTIQGGATLRVDSGSSLGLDNAVTLGATMAEH